MSRDHALGIDLGKDGWAVIVGPDGRIVTHWPTPTLAAGGYAEARMLHLLRASADRVGLAVLEDAVLVPGQQAGTLQVGLGLGLWRMALCALEIPREVVPPATWKRAMGVLVAPTKKNGKTLAAELREHGWQDARQLSVAARLLRQRRKQGEELDAAQLATLALWDRVNDRSRDRKAQAKGASVAKAQELYPGVDFRASERAKAPHDGKCEAALIAAYALRRMRGQA